MGESANSCSFLQESALRGSVCLFTFIPLGVPKRPAKKRADPAAPPARNLGVIQRPLTLILLQKHRDTNRRRFVIQIGGVHTTFCQGEGILLQKYRDRNGRCIAILFKSIGVAGRFDSPVPSGFLFGLFWATTASAASVAKAIPSTFFWQQTAGNLDKFRRIN